MPLSHIEHFLLQTDDMEATRDWYVRVLGMRVGPSPDFKFPVFWLYQLSLMDPNEVKIELNFDQAEADAAGIAPELIASELPA